MRCLVAVFGVLLACSLNAGCGEPHSPASAASSNAPGFNPNEYGTSPAEDDASAHAPPRRSPSITPPPPREVPCGVTNTDLTLDDCKAAGKWAAQATNGTASFEAPTAMRQGETKIVQLAIGTRPPPGEASANSIQPTADQIQRAVTNGEGQVIDYHPLVGRRMAADLSGVGFDVTQVGDRVQQVTDNNITIWQWQIKAKDLGTKTLVLRTAVTMLDSTGVETSLAPTTTTRIVTVAVGGMTVMSFLKTLQGLIAAVTAVVVAVGGLYFALRHFGAKGAEGGGTSPGDEGTGAGG